MNVNGVSNNVSIINIGESKNNNKLVETVETVMALKLLEGAYTSLQQTLGYGSSGQSVECASVGTQVNAVG